MKFELLIPQKNFSNKLNTASEKVLLIDNFDSFTYMLADYVKQCGAECDILRNNVSFSEINIDHYTSIILSPGPGTPAQSGNLLKIISEYYQKVPILGVCLGHQALGEFFGANLVKAEKPMHGKLSYISCKVDEIFNHTNVWFNVVRYHSLILENLPDSLGVIAQTESGEIMALKHNFLPLRGIQFHPEAILTEFGIQIIRNWIDFCRKAEKTEEIN